MGCVRFAYISVLPPFSVRRRHNADLSTTPTPPGYFYVRGRLASIAPQNRAFLPLFQPTSVTSICESKRAGSSLSNARSKSAGRC